MRFKYIVQSLILFFTLNMSVSVFAQLVVDEGSFKEVVGFVNINTDKMYDDNDRAYAVLKVKTENINDRERHRLLFEGDARTFFELEYKPGEVWVYISYYATYLKISHPDFGSTEFWFPFDMQGKKGYEMILINKPFIDQEFADRLAKLEGALAGGAASGGFGYLVIKTTSVDGATVIIDGQKMETNTPFVSDKLNVGPHRVRIEKDFYKPYVTIVNIEDGKSNNLDVELEKTTGSLEIITQPTNANIKIGAIDKGKSPNVFDDMHAGDYKIELSKKNYETVVKETTIVGGEKTVLEVNLQRKTFRKIGWVIRPEIGVGMMESPHKNLFSYSFRPNYIGYSYKTNDIYGVYANVGYQINPIIFMGVGVGLNLMDKMSLLYTPLYINPRFYVNDRKTSMYFNIKLGFSLSDKSSKGSTNNEGAQYLSNKVSAKGLMGAFEIGFEYKQSSLGLAINAQNILFETTYEIEFTGFKSSYNETMTTEKLFFSVMIKYGYSIFMK